jgi:hypothetical protein
VTAGSVSVGLVQTLISTAQNTINNWLDNRVDYDTEFNVNRPPNPSSGADFFDWLLNGRNAILVGAAYQKMKFGDASSKLILPFVAAYHNAGGLVEDLTENPFGLLYYGDYPQKFARYYNAIVEDIKNGLNVESRFLNDS